MLVNQHLNSRIEQVISSDKVVLFMKGTPAQPQCGFSASVVEILSSMLPDYTTFNVLEDQAVREGIKEYSQWPTIPQLYIEKEFVGGCDIVKQMFNTGDLHRLLGAEAPDTSAPELHIDDNAASAIKQALQHQPGVAVHLRISPSWEHQFNLGPAQGHEIRSESNGVEVLFDLMSAQRAHGLVITMAETAQGSGFNIQNPNAPPPVKNITPSELKDKLDNHEPLRLFDVREPHEREKAYIEGSRLLDRDTVALIETLPRDEMLVFYCHHGPRSYSAADYFRQQGYTNVYNLTGGIDAWSQRVDADVPRY